VKKKLISLVMTSAVLAAGSMGIGSSAQAAAKTYPINGSKACYDTAWFTSSTIRTVNSGNSTIKAKVADAGTGGIQLNVLRVNDNALGTARQYPPLDSYQTLATGWGAGTQFKFRFNCVNIGSNSSSVWLGTASY
jgi:hypothetical protein